MYFLFWTFILVAGIILLHKSREQDEDFLVLKLLGYFFLGTFTLRLGGLVLPLGFIITLFMRPGANRSIKRGSAIFGLVLMIIGLLLR
jgi:formate-dependent nitrite reductase membrane component NrfD